jgi:hypothetical protein
MGQEIEDFTYGQVLSNQIKLLMPVEYWHLFLLPKQKGKLVRKLSHALRKSQPLLSFSRTAPSMSFPEAAVK